jgi:protein-tyrosine phosphatase
MLSNIIATIKLAYNKTKEYINNPYETTTTEDRYYNDRMSIYDQYISIKGKPTHIIDGIYLGSAHNAANYEILKEEKIEIILNITKDIYNYYPEEFKYYKYEINDDDKSDIDNILEETYNILKNNKDKKILVHCLMGASRSCSVVLYYLMNEYKMKLEEAIEYIKKKRDIINPNMRFIRILERKK